MTSGGQMQVNQSTVNSYAEQHDTLATQISQGLQRLDNEVHQAQSASQNDMTKALVQANQPFQDKMQTVVKDLQSMAENMRSAASAQTGMDEQNRQSVTSAMKGFLS